MDKRSKLQIEPLENRLVPTITNISLTGTTLSVTGNSGNDMVQFTNIVINNVTYVAVTYRQGNSDNFNSQFFLASQVTVLSANLDGGNDYVANVTSVTAVFDGGTGLDYMEGGFGDDVLNSGAGDDFMVDNRGGRNTFLGDGGNDIASSTVAGANMQGGDGDDLLYDIIPGGNTFDAGTGTDVVVSRFGDAVNNVGAGDIDVRFGQSTNLFFVDADRDVLFIFGTEAADSITVNDGGNNNITANVTTGGVTTSATFSRNDVRAIGVLGNGGDDYIDNNTGESGPGALFMVAYGGAGNDDQRGSGGRDFLKGGGGNDNISGRSSGGDVIGGDAGFDTLRADDGAGVESNRDFIYADPGETVLTDGQDVVGGQFNDRNWFNT